MVGSANEWTGGTDEERYYHGVLLEYNDFGNYGVLDSEAFPISVEPFMISA